MEQLPGRIRYFFRFFGVQEAPHHAPNIDAYHRWSPPKALGSNVYNGRETQTLFYCDGRRIQPWSSLPDGVQVFKTFSIYYNQGRFWLVNYDATRYQVGDGEDVGNTTRPAYMTERDSGGCWANWQPLTFDHDEEANPYASIATFGGEHPTLRTQRPDQRWPGILLPPVYHAHESAWAPNTQYGGLSGDLPLILSLLAFSIRPERVESYFTRRFVNGMFRMHDHGHGRLDKRGMIVVVYWHPDLCSDDLLKQYEEGIYGKIFP